MSGGVDPGPVPPSEPLPPHPPDAPAPPPPPAGRAAPRPPPLPGGARRWEIDHDAAAAARAEPPLVEEPDAPVPAPYVPVLPGRRPRWWALLLGLSLVALGLWLAIGLAPEIDALLDRADADAARREADEGEHDPLRVVRRTTRPWERRSLFSDDEGRYEIDGETFTREELEAVRFLGWFLVAAGAAMAVLLGSHRPGRIRFCTSCERDTLFLKRSGWRCERCRARW